jgi:hypothetical protein
LRARRGRWQRFREFFSLLGAAPPVGNPISALRVRPRLWNHGPTRIAIRTLDAEPSQRLRQRAVRLCGFPNFTPVLLAAAFRAVDGLAVRHPWILPVLYTHVPISLRPRLPGAPVLHNNHAYLMVRVRRRQLADRDALVRLLQQQLRRRIGRDIGLG